MKGIPSFQEWLKIKDTYTEQLSLPIAIWMARTPGSAILIMESSQPTEEEKNFPDFSYFDRKYTAIISVEIPFQPTKEEEEKYPDEIEFWKGDENEEKVVAIFVKVISSKMFKVYKGDDLEETLKHVWKDIWKMKECTSMMELSNVTKELGLVEY